MALALRHRLALAVLFGILTVGLRLATLLASAPPKDDGALARMEGVLQSQGFTTVPVTNMSGIVVARGDKRFCQVTLAQLAPMGWENDVLLQMRGDGDNLAYVYGGEPMAAPPVWQARIEYFYDRLRRTLRLSRKPIGLYGVIMSSWCRPDDIDLTVLR